ncbi:MAG TPA: chemotaxis protein CheW [Methanoregulaceae archaeon]|nr:chemotaxis protein CheW [Methanoregulaceae archaeon]
MVDLEQGECKTENIMNEKPGRKVLLVGGPCKPALVSQSIAQEDLVIRQVEGLISSGIHGDYSGRIDEGTVVDPWKPLVKAVNELNQRREEEKEQLSRLSKIRESILEKNPIPVLVLDNELSIREANEAFSRVSGIPMETLPGMALNDLSIISQTGGGPIDAMKFRRHSVSEMMVDLPSGVHIFEQYNIPLISDSGTISGITSLFFDKTQEKQEEEQLRRTIEGLNNQLQEWRRSQETSSPDPVMPPHVGPNTHIDTAREKPLQTENQELKQKKEVKKIEKIRTFDVVEFSLGGEKYALDINLAREIVEMMPITQIPCSPAYLKGIMNLRGEITNIIDIHTVLGLSRKESEIGNKIIVLSAEATGGQNLGVIVDDVQSVIQIQETDVEQIGENLSSQSSNNIKGIIKIGGKGAERKGDRDTEKELVIWIDMLKVLEGLTQLKNSTR